MLNTTYNVRITDDCIDINWIGQQLKKIADALNDRYDPISSLLNIGRRLRFVGDSFNDRNNAIIVRILSSAELCLRLM